jgi:hypothetical protein
MCKSLIAAGDHLFSKRMPLMSLWQEIGDHFYPERAHFTRMLSIGEEFAAHLMTSFPLMARRDLGNSFASMLRRGEWFHMRAAREDREDQAAKEWLEWATATQRRAMYARPTQFTRAVSEGDHDFATFGQCAISVELNRTASDLLYRCWHLKDLAWCENADGVIDTFHLKWNPTAKDLVRMFPKTAPENVRNCLDKEPYKEINCRRIVVPSDDYENKAGKKRTPYTSIFIDVENETVLEEVGVYNKIFVLPRWQTVSGSQYAYSPATIIALPDARLIQQMTLVLLEAGEKAVNPPMIAYKEAIKSDMNTYAGGVTWVDYSYDERTGAPVQPLYNDKTGIPAGLNMRDDIRAMIHEAFYLNKLTLPAPTTGDMTAYEVSQRVQEYIRQALPIFGPMETEYNGELCELTFDVLLRAGTFAGRELPDSLSKEEVQFRFESPLQAAIESEKVGQFQQSAALLAAAVEMDPTAKANFDVHAAFRAAITGTGAPADWLNSEEEAAAITQGMQQQQQAQQMIMAAQEGGAAVEQLGKANQAVEGVAA